MYAIALIRYRQPLEEVMAVTERHRAYLRQLKDDGLLIASEADGSADRGDVAPPGAGRRCHRDAGRIRDGDPYVTFGMAQYEMIPWAVGIGKEALDAIGVA